MKNQRGFAGIGAFIVIALWVAAIGGWIANVVKLVGMLDGAVTTMFIARVVGVFAAPLGSVLGYF
jgi:hypothetical protein